MLKIFKNFILLLCFFPSIILTVYATYETETIFGKLYIDDPIIEEIIKSPAMQRLKHIDQSGTLTYLGYMPRYNRYEHSLGVYALLKKYNVSFREQVAGLLHDVSHTVFSHVADVLFKNFSQDISYQDDIHEWFLNKTNIGSILKKRGLAVKDISLNVQSFSALDQELPSLCADRIEYLLHTGLILGKVTKEDVNKVIEDLRYENNKWFFTNVDSAKKIAFLSLYLTEEIYGAPWNYVLYYWSAEFLKRALSLKLITIDDIHFGRDKEIFIKITNCSDKIIRNIFNKCKNSEQYYKVMPKDYDVIANPKFRGVDPFVSTGERLILLSHIDKNFRKEFERVKAKIKNGIRIKFIN